MDDFSARERKLERERQARIAAKKREQEQEAAAAQRYAEQQLQQREALAKRRAEREQEEERRAEAQRADARLTGGLTWRRTYRCVAEPRDGDRVRLPDSSLSELTSAGLLQDATALTLELELVEAKTGPGALAYQIEQAWKTLNVGPFLILTLALLFGTDLQRLAASVLS